MKRAAMVVVTLLVVAWAMAQPTPQAQQTPPAGQAGTPQAGTAQTGAAATPAPGKRPPQAKSQAEFNDYLAASKETDPAALEKAADDFATKYPDSELRILLYKDAMHSYQNANNGSKMAEMADKVLKLDPDDPEALLASSEVIAERTRETDLDKDQRYEEATKEAQHALTTIDTDVAVPAGTPQERVDAYKNLLRSSLYSVLGTIDFNQEKYPDAETLLRKSIDAYPAQPDSVVVLRLAIALDKQGKYAEALKQANTAVEMTQDNTSTGTLARRERDRLVQLTGGSPSSAPAPAAKPPAGSPQPSNPPH